MRKRKESLLGPFLSDNASDQPDHYQCTDDQIRKYDCEECSANTKRSYRHDHQKYENDRQNCKCYHSLSASFLIKEVAKYADKEKSPCKALSFRNSRLRLESGFL